MSRLRAVAAFVGRHFKPIAAVATAVGVAVALYSQRRAIAAFDWRISWDALVASVALFAVAPVVQGISFWAILRLLRVRSRFDEALVLWMRSFLLRYAPTGALAFVIRIRERDRLGASSAAIWTASGYEQLVALAAGGFACLAGFAFARSWPPAIALALAGVALAATVAARPRFFGTAVQALLRKRGLDVPVLLRGRALALVVAINATGWIATGAAAWLLIDALAAEPAPAIAWVIGVYALAWMLGFVVPLLPGGLGLREGTLVAFLGGAFGVGVATALVLALRFANTLGEFAAIGFTELAYRSARAARPRGPQIWLEVRRRRASDPRAP